MRRFLFSILLVALSARAYTSETDLKEVIARPQRFDGQEITTRGLGAVGGVGGNALYLYPDFATAAKGARDTHHAAYAADKLMKSRSFTMDDSRCWFEITGIVRAGRHGPWGDNPCEIEIKSIRKLYREKRVLWPEDIGLFLNATSTKVSIDADLPDGGETLIQIAPNDIGPLEILSGGIITFEKWSESGSPQPIMFRTKVDIPSRKSHDPSKREFRFVIHEDRLEAADPSVRIIKK